MRPLRNSPWKFHPDAILERPWWRRSAEGLVRSDGRFATHPDHEGTDEWFAEQIDAKDPLPPVNLSPGQTWGLVYQNVNVTLPPLDVRGWEYPTREDIDPLSGLPPLGPYTYTSRSAPIEVRVGMIWVSYHEATHFLIRACNPKIAPYLLWDPADPHGSPWTGAR